MKEIIKETSLMKLLKDNKVYFDFYRNNKLYYYIIYKGLKWQFPVPINDTGTGYFNASDKAILFMRWIRKAKEGEELYVEKVKKSLYIKSLLLQIKNLF